MIVGDVVRCYKNGNTPDEFDCFVELIEYQPGSDEIQLSLKTGEKVTGKPPFVYDEVRNPTIQYPEIGSYLWYESELCPVIRLDKRSDEIWIKTHDKGVLKLTYPFPVETYYNEDFYEISYRGEYLGYVHLVKDVGRYLYVVDNSGEKLKLRRKDAEVKVQRYEPRTVLWTAQRWLVKPLVPSFPTMLNGDVWFGSIGLCENLVYDKGICKFEVNGVLFEEKYNPSLFLVKGGDNAMTTHRNISFYLTTDSDFSSYSHEWDIYKYVIDEEE